MSTFVHVREHFTQIWNLPHIGRKFIYNPSMTRQAIQKNLLTILIPLAIISLAIQPLLTGHMPWQGDGLLHYVRLAVLQNDVARGDWFPRWSPDLAYGYGFPLFNFYAPFSYYVGLPFRWLGFSLKAATNMSYILAMWVMATGAYLWGKDAWNKTAGAVAAVLLCYNPYILNNLLHRSALAELWGLAWLMATLWGVQRLFDIRPIQRGGRLTTFLITTLCYTALMLSHNITAMIGTPFIVGYAVYLAFTVDPITAETDAPPPFFRVDRSAYGLLFIPFALALSAFFWLPAFVEKDLVQVERLVDGANFAYENHFLPASFFGSSLAIRNLPTNSAWLNPPLLQGFGIYHFMMILFPAFISLLIILIPKGRKRWLPHRYILKYIGIYTLATLAPTLLAYSISSFLWENLPLLSFVQFPWRFVGLGAIALTLLTIKTAQFFELGSERIRKQEEPPMRDTPQQWKNLYIVLGIQLLFTFCFVGSNLVKDLNIYFWPASGPSLPLLEEQATADITTFEVETGWLGTTAAGDYLPDTVLTLPLPQDRPPYSISQNEFTLAEAQTIIFDQLFFPSWQVKSNGAIIEAHASEPFGFIQIELPAGIHKLNITQKSTPIQQTGNTLSAFAAIGFLALGVFSLFGQRNVRNESEMLNTPPIVWRSWAFGALVVAIALPLVPAVLKTAIFDRGDSSLHINNPQLPPSAYNRVFRYGDEIRLINFENQLILLDQAPIDFDTDNPIQPRTDRLFWYSPNATQDYSVSIHIKDFNGYLYGQSDHLHPGNIPVTKWSPNVFVSDDHTFTMKSGSPIDSYDLELIIYDAEGRRLNVLNENGQPIGNSHRLDTIRVQAASSPEEVRAEIDNLMPIPACMAEVCLTGYNILRIPQTAVGDLYPLTLFTERPENKQALPYIIPLKLISKESGAQASLPVQVFDPMGVDTMADHIRRVEHAFYVPSAFDDGSPLDSGTYTLFYGSIPLHTFNIQSPDRTFDSEPLLISRNVLFEELVILDSVDLNQDLTALDPAQPLVTSFLWRPQESTDQSYKVFVQLLNSEQRIVAQSDKIPFNGDTPRPSTSWVSGEYLLDTHQLFLPADLDPTAEYTLIVGLYNEATGERLTAQESETNLTYITIQP